MQAEAPYNHQRPTEGEWVPADDGDGFVGRSNEIPHIREIRLFHAKAAAGNFFTDYVLAYERLVPLAAPPDPEPEPEPGAGGNGSSVNDAIYAADLPFNLSIAKPVTPVMWVKARLPAAGDYEFTTATPVDVADPSGPDTFLALYDSQGVVLDTNDDADPSSRDYRSRIVRQGMSAGNYFVAITGYGANAMDGFDIEVGDVLPGDVNFAVLAYVPPPPPPLTKITLPYREDFPLTKGELLYWYEVDLPAGFYAFDTGESLHPQDNDTSMAIYSADGKLLNYSSDIGNGDYRDKLIFAVSEAGTFRMVLCTNGASYWDDFGVEPREPLNGGVVLQVYELQAGNGSSHQEPMWAKPVPYRVEIAAPAELPVLWYEVDLEHGPALTIFSTKATADEQADTFLALFNEHGDLIAKNDTSSVLLNDPRARLALEYIGGKYFVALGGAGCDASDGFTVTPGGAIPVGTVLEVEQKGYAEPDAVPFVSPKSFPSGGPALSWYRVEKTNSSRVSYRFTTNSATPNGASVRMALYGEWGNFIMQSSKPSDDDGRESLAYFPSQGVYYLAVAGQGAEFAPQFEVNAIHPLTAGTSVNLSII